MLSISFLGSHLLALILPVALYSFLFSVIGAAQKRSPLVASAGRATTVVFVLLTLSALLVITAFVTGDFSLSYVARYSSRSLPLFFKITGLWAGLDGSILLWVWLVSLYSFLVFQQNHKKNPDWTPIMNAVFMAVVLFFVSVMLFANNPFTPLGVLPPDGQGLNPLLQNVAMVVHPPSLYLGYTGFTVPFAFLVAALITRRLDVSWIDASRRWTMIAWFFLTLGNILGAAWAYVELGWGGFWAWDPVENAAFMPWLTASAYIHSVLIQKKRGMLMMWNAVLLSLTFLLTLLGTYLTRSGVVQSVHAFSESKLGPYFLGFLGLVTAVVFGLIIWRRKDLKSVNQIESYLSKESAFLANNVLFVIATVAVLWGTLFPTLSEAITGQRITVGAPFFNKMMAPLGVMILALMGVGPMIGWRKASANNLIKNILAPLVVGGASLVIIFLLGFRHWYVLVTGGLMVFVIATIILEFKRGMTVLKIQKKLTGLAAFLELLITNNRRYGGYLVHVGLVFIFLAIAGTVYKAESDFTLKPGESYVFGSKKFNYIKHTETKNEHAAVITAEVDYFENNKKIATLYPARNFYFASQQPTTEVSLFHHPFSDVYLIVGNYNADNELTDFRVTFNPLISFMWLGGFVILLGTVIVLLPRGFKWRGRVSSMLLFICISLLGSSQLFAAENFVHQEKVDAPFVNANDNDPLVARQKHIAEQLNCKCGDCVRQDLRTCTCGYAKKEREKIMLALKDNKSDDQILQSFATEYGPSAYVVPPQKGFLQFGPEVPWIIGVVLLILFACLLKSWRRVPVAPISQNQNIEKSPLKEKILKELEHFDDH